MIFIKIKDKHIRIFAILLIYSNGQTFKTDPNNSDSDGDGLLDGQEILINYNIKRINGIDKTNSVYFKCISNPESKDSDNDGRIDNPIIYYPLVNYNPNDALSYAYNWYDSQGTSIGNYNIFPKHRNTNYYYYNRGNCANFISQCLFAGGFEMYGSERNDGWHSLKLDDNNNKLDVDNFKVSASWSEANTQYDYFKNSDYNLNGNDTITILPSDFDDNKQLTKFLSTYNIKVGDLLYMDYENDGKVNHATMISKITEHMISFTAQTDDYYDRDISETIKNRPSCIFHIIRIVK